MAPDGADHEVIEDNVIDPGSYPFAITLWSDNGSIVRHNTLPDGACAWNLRCGILTVGSKTGEPAGRGTVVKDNILGEVTVGSGSATFAERDYNLIATGSPVGAQDLRGRPGYSGGSAPSSYDEFTLASGSAGEASASDSADRGIGSRTTPGSVPAVTPDPAPTAAPDPGPANPLPPTPAGGATRPAAPGSTLTATPMTLAMPKRIRWARLMRGLRLRAAGASEGTRLRVLVNRPGRRRLVADRRFSVGAGERTLVLRPRPGAMGRRRDCTIRVQVKVTIPGAPARTLRARLRVSR
jgi:hypothetical protein